MSSTLTAYLISGKRFPDARGHDQAEDDRNAFIAHLQTIAAYASVDFRPWAWDGPPVNIDNDVTTDRLLVVGYSFGGNTALTWAGQAKERFIDHLILLDPVNPANFLSPSPPFEVPLAVRIADCYTRSGFHFPWPASRKINVDRPNLQNHDVDEDHQNFYRNAAVHQYIKDALDQLLNPNFITWTHAPLLV